MNSIPEALQSSQTFLNDSLLTQQPELITISSSGKFFGVRNKRKLHVWEVIAHDHEGAPIKKITLHHTKNLTVFAFHPTERIVAAGDMKGLGLGDDDADSCATWHWHSAEVKVLSFSSDGAYLFSGGKEGVLVFWQLDTGKKKFLPRIGSPLLYFTTSLDPSLSSVSCADNRIHLLKMPSMEILKSISGIKVCYQSKSARETINQVMMSRYIKLLSFFLV
ncbi:WD repeat-containing protein 75 [Vitis vinifera]|uniref:WD repeat-containing protein 75 n=1 Tax=Vitis vinifera TaxID=29760 RepID=A0A438DC92_VITVI|nr:WD repeat-containing protein 75 [Vitis vinifera]